MHNLYVLFETSRAPITTGTSVLGITFEGGVAIAADILGSYGSLARFRNCPRIMHVNDNIILGAGGDYADYQYLKDVIEQKMYVSKSNMYTTCSKIVFIVKLLLC